MTKTRLVVTGQNAAGKSVIVEDRVIDPIYIGVDMTPLWASDEPPRFPINGQRTSFTKMFPPLGGYRFMVMTIPPDTDPKRVPDISAEERAKIGTGAQEHAELDNPGMHTTDTVDFEVVLSGEASQEFDDGQVVHLKAGDCFVQNGTRHRWFNRGTEPAVVAVVLIGGQPRDRG